MSKVFILFFIMFAGPAFAADPEQEQPQVIPLDVSVKQDHKVDWLLQAHRQVMKAEKGIPGFRIQVAAESGNQSRVRIQKNKYDFDAAFPQLKSYIIYDAPYYKLRVGDFRSRLDARRFMERISREYRNAFIVVDQINFPELD